MNPNNEQRRSFYVAKPTFQLCPAGSSANLCVPRFLCFLPYFFAAVLGFLGLALVAGDFFAGLALF